MSITKGIAKHGSEIDKGLIAFAEPASRVRASPSVRVDTSIPSIGVPTRLYRDGWAGTDLETLPVVSKKEPDGG